MPIQNADIAAVFGGIADRLEIDTGSCAPLEPLRQDLPPTITELLALPGIGPTRARALHRELDLSTGSISTTISTASPRRGVAGWRRPMC